MTLSNQFIDKIKKAPYKRKQTELVKKALRRQPISRTQEQSRFAAARALESTPTHWAQPEDPNQLRIPWNDEVDIPDEPDEVDDRDGATLSHRMNYGIAQQRRRDDEISNNFSVIDNSKEGGGTRKTWRALAGSDIPNTAFEDLAHTSVINDGSRLNPYNAKSAYSSGFKTSSNDLRTLRGHNRYSPESINTYSVTHETGHTADRMARGTGMVGISGDRGKDLYRGSGTISAAGEGYADGIAHRFTRRVSLGGPPTSEEGHLTRWGYQPEHFDTDDRKAMFVASRAHAWTTGQLTQGANMAEAVHNAGSNPAVRQAIRAHGMTSTAKNLSEQFMAKRKQGTQLSLLGSEDEYDVYDADDVDWDK